MKDARHSLTWVSHPAADDPLYKFVLLVGLMLGISVGASWAFDQSGELLFGVLAFVLLFLSMARFFLPTRYHLTEDGLRVRFLGRKRHRPWSEFRNFYPYRIGVLLTPFPRPSRLDSFRGQFLRFNGNHDEVLEFIARHIKK